MPPKAAPKKVDLTTIKVPVWAKPGKAIWVEILDELGVVPVNYLMGRIDQVMEEAKKVTVLYEGEGASTGEKEVYADRILERSEEPQVLEDLVDIDPLNDAELLKCLEIRFRRDMLYCFCGPTLLATNPYKKVAGLTLSEDKELFRKYALKGGKRITLPHIWNISSRAFYSLFDGSNRKQAMCISGESGAGKTFGTKLCMGFITSLFENEETKKEGEIPVEDQILNCNPILESFGNAKTVRNDNSSRFGKYFLMYVDKGDKHIKGAEIRNYLLEKSRVITQALTERNYHVFYGILRFMPPDMLKKYEFCNDGDKVKMEGYNYLLKSKCFIWETIDDMEFYNDTSRSFKELGFDAEETEAVYKTLSCVLNLGNVEIDKSAFDAGTGNCTFKDSVYLEKVCRLLNVDKTKLIESCCTKTFAIPGQPVSKIKRSGTQSEGVRDALAKDLFNNTFNWIVKKLNKELLPKVKCDFITIGLLDIFGFEDFDINSLEQFCINYTNEKLQNLYISYVFKAEKVIFEEEGLASFLDMIKFVDNMPIIDLLDKKPAGIYLLINSVGKQAQDDGKDDAKLMDQIKKQHEKNPYMFFHKMKQEVFGVRHTAKKVFYYSPGFIEKNRDELPPDLLAVLDGGDRVMMRIFKNKLTDDEVIEDKVIDPEEKFLGTKFRKEMASLMTELLESECHFVRCIKPNEEKRKDFWVPALALNQIRYLGILDSINVRRESLPVRKFYEEFYAKYQDLDKFSPERNTSYLKLKDSKPDWKKLTENTIKSVQENPPNHDVLFGNTRIFMSNPFTVKLEEALEEKQKVKRIAIDKIVKNYKPYEVIMRWNNYRSTTLKVISLAKNLFNTWNSKIEYIRFKKVLDVTKRMQRNYRMLMYKRVLRLQRYSTLVIARSYQMFKIRSVLFNANKVAGVLSRCARKVMFRHFLMKKHRNEKILNDVFEKAWDVIETKMKIAACLEIQRIFRGFNARVESASEVKRLEVIKAEVKKNKAATMIQKVAKGFLVRSRLDRLHRAAGFIQGYTRMLWLSKYYQLLRKSTIKIQVFVRKYLLKNSKIQERMGAFLSSAKQYIRHLRTVEHDIIFKQKNSFYDLNNLENYTKVKFFEDEQSFRDSIPTMKTFIPELPSMELNPKMRLFSVLIDFDCQVDTSDIYERSWAVDYLTLMQRLNKEGSRLMHIEVGESFTLAVNDEGKIYSWGLNDYMQLGRKIDPRTTHNEPKLCKPLQGLYPRIISSGDEHTIMVDYANDVYIWGGNSSGQLGVGHSRDNRNIIKLESLGKGIKAVTAKGKRNYLVTNDGKLYCWPNKSNTYKFVASPVPVIDQKTEFSQVTCGHDFAIALTINGLLYSSGDNKNGQLGQGDTMGRDAFTRIDSLKEYGEKITEVSCGHQHVICKSATGKVFTWGLGASGQLGLGTRKSAMLPMHVKGKDQTVTYKARSVQATFCSSYILYETRKVYHAGPDSSNNGEDIYFKMLDYEPKVTHR
jgi:myosin-5